MKHPSFLLAGFLVALLGAGCQPAPLSERPATPSAPVATPGAATSTAPIIKPAPTPASVPKPAPAPAPKPTAPKPQTVTVTIMGFQYFPQTVTVNDGDTVVWVNKDSAPHTSTSDGVLLWDSGALQLGGTYKRVFRTGVYQYHCNVHPSMKGTVIVR